MPLQPQYVHAHMSSGLLGTKASFDASWHEMFSRLLQHVFVYLNALTLSNWTIFVSSRDSVETDLLRVRVVQASSLPCPSHLFEGLSDLETHGSLSLRTRFVFTFFSVAFGVRRLFFSLLFGISNDLNHYFLRIYDPKYYFRSFSKVPNF